MEKTNPELDFTSSEFNALEALTSPDVEIPVPEAPMFNNLAQFISAQNRTRARQTQTDTDGV